MERSTIIAIAILSVFIIVMAFVSYDSDEAIFTLTEEAAEEAFNSESVEANYETDDFSFYLPENLEVGEIESNNVILTSGDQLFLLFYNPLEDPASDLSYTQAQTDDSLLLEAFEDGEKFGYIRIIDDVEEKVYELQIGIGGVKITTMTTREKLEQDAVQAMEIANSIVLN